MRISDWSSDVCSSDLSTFPSREKNLSFAEACARAGGGSRPLSRAAPRPLRPGVPVRRDGQAGGTAVRVPGPPCRRAASARKPRSEEHTSEHQSQMRISYAVIRLHKKTIKNKHE